MKTQNQEDAIIFPKGMENIPVRIICDEDAAGVTVKITNPSQTDKSCSESEGLHTAIYHQDRYEHVPMKEILWVEANGSYCCVYMANEKKIILSCPLVRIQEVLPESVFIRIHRSFLVNVNYIKYLTGKSVAIGDKLLKIGNSYYDVVIDRIISLGIRHRPIYNKKDRRSFRRSTDVIDKK